MRRLIPIVALAVAGALPAAAQANQATAPRLSCGQIDGAFTAFPAGPQTVILRTSVDGVPQPDQAITANGPDFNTSTGYRNPDAGSHVLSAYFAWTNSDGPGQSPVATSTVTNCPPPASVPAPSQVTQQTSTQQNSSAPPSTQSGGNAPSSTRGRAPSTSGGSLPTDLAAFVCRSRRVYRFTVRRSIGGSRIVGIVRVLVRGSERYGSYSRRRVRGHRRFVVRADYRGLTVPRGQLRTITTFVRLANGKTVRTVQFVRLCLPRDGNPNDTPSQDRAPR